MLGLMYGESVPQDAIARSAASIINDYDIDGDGKVSTGLYSHMLFLLLDMQCHFTAKLTPAFVFHQVSEALVRCLM